MIRILTHERAGRLLAGAAVLVSVAMALLVSPWFLLGAAGTAVNLMLSGITDRCAVKSLLVRMGLPGERDLGRAEATLSGPADPPLVFRRTVRQAKVAAN